MLADAAAGFNVYCEIRTVRPGLRGRERGELSDTVAVFALARDNDRDEAGKGGTLDFTASLVVASSPSSSHDYIFLPAGISAQEAYNIGQSMRAATGGDSNTGSITQPYRVAGTPNYPNPKKRQRGRVVAATHIAKSGGPVWTREQLIAAFPPVAAQQANDIPTGLTGIVDDGVEELVAERSKKRGTQLFIACIAARAVGMTPDDLEALMRQHPHGCASKFLKPQDRLRKEIVRAWGKIDQRATVEPTYLDNARTSVEEARAELEQLIEQFFEPRKWWEDACEIQRQYAVQATTGIGKTQTAARVIARRVRSGLLATPVGYAVPTHRLGEDIAEQFRAHGITAEVWRGRKACISGKSGPTMCDELGVVKIAEDMGAVIESACCKGKDPNGKPVMCPFYQGCAYQGQKSKEPDVWVFAHQMLFQQNKTLKGMSVLFVDESFRDAGMSKPVKGLTLDEIKNGPLGELSFYRDMLAKALWAQPDNGGVPRANLVKAELFTDDCTRAIELEWAQKETRPTLWPGMPAKLRAAAAKAGSNTKHIRTFHRVWSAARELIELEGDVVSGRLFMANHKTEHGNVRVVRTRGIRKVATQYLVPTFIMDATLPSKSILEKWFPDVKVVGNIEVPMRHVRVRQVLGAPITKKKLEGGGRSLQAVRRYVLQRHVETGRGDTLVIAQKDIEAALQATGLPPAIHGEHFNAISGLDEHKRVRLLITIGRTQPEPAAVEEDAGALSGVEPAKAKVKANRRPWYDKVTRGMRLRDGSGVAVSADQHPDPLAEAVRQQICEAGLLQSVGRGRGVNRGPGTPLDIDIVADVVLPVTIDRVDEWRPPSLEVEMAVEGIWLESPADLARAWPSVWRTPQAAKDWLRGKMVGFPLVEYFYQGKVHHLRYRHHWR